MAVAAPVVAWRTGCDLPAALLLSVASGCYLFGAVGVTIVANVPLNNQLATAAASTVSADTWTRWVSAWSSRNHIRTGAAAAACLLYSVGLAHIEQ